MSSVEPDVSRLMSVGDAMAAIDAVPVMPQMEQVALGDAVGRRLAEEVATDRDYPPFDKSLMDGFAVRVGESVGAFDLVGEVAAGGGWSGEPITGRQAVAIMTGAPLPPGEIGIVPVEHSRRDGKVVHLDITAVADKWIARQGGDRSKGTIVLHADTLLGPVQIAALATVGCATLSIYSRPRCAVIATGDEVIPVGQSPAGSQMRNANSPMLVALLNRLGCDAYDAGHVGDDADAIRHRLGEMFAFEHPSDFDPQPDPNLPDIIFLTGGMSMGEHDHVWKAIAEMTEVKVSKLRIRPGKPFVFGHRQAAWTPPEQLIIDGLDEADTHHHHQYVFGLPGNPVSAFVCTVVLASRLLTRLGGGDAADCDRRFVEMPLAGELPANGPRTFYQPATLDSGRVVSLAWRGSADVFTLAQADALIERPENDPSRNAGELVRVLQLH